MLSFGAAALIAVVALKLRSLSPSGALAATALGGTIVVLGGWTWGAILIAFFLSSSALSKLTAGLRPAQGANVKRGSQRDALQVIANGGIAGLCAAGWAISEHNWFLAAFAASLSAAAADTWATELGAFSRRPPRLITTLKPVVRGASGGISPLGTAATIAGSLFIAVLSAFLLGGSNLAPARLFGAVAIAGVLGSLTDSLLGATIQIHYRCPACNEVTEQTVHRCGTATIPERGIPFFTNDVVNITAIVVGAIVGGLLAF